MSYNKRKAFNNNAGQNNNDFGRQNNFGRPNHQGIWPSPRPINPPYPIRENFDRLNNFGFGNFQSFDRVENVNFQNLNRPRNNNHFRNDNRSLSVDSGRFDQLLNYPPPEKRMRTESCNPSAQNYNFNPSLGPPRNLPPPPKLKNFGPTNSFAKFRSLEEFKDFRKSLKIRKSIEEKESNNENNNPDFIFISPIDLEELKDDIYIAMRRKPSDPEAVVDEICRAFARFQYFITFKDKREAKEQSKKKSLPPKDENFYFCQHCDCFFTSRDVLNAHIDSSLHQQVSKIGAETRAIGKEYLKLYTNPNKIHGNSSISEKVGILVCLKDADLEYSKLDVNSMDEDSFVLAALEERMKTFWPHPKSDFFCRCCNYSEFSSQALLDRHLKSARHLGFDRDYNEAFCIVCQYHYGDAIKMREHQDTKEHEKASYLMDFTKKQALEYWNYWHLKDRNVILGENHKSLASDKKPTLLDQVEHTSKDEEKKQVPSQVPLVDVSESSSSKDLKESETISVKTAEASSFTTSSSSLDDGKNTIKKDSPKKIVDIIHIKDGDSCPDLKVDDNKISDIKDTTDLDIDKFKNYVSGKKPADDQTKPNEETENKPVEDIRPTPQFDEFIVPLTGYMCTVCHETLADKDKASAHKKTNSHKEKVKTHELLFG